MQYYLFDKNSPGDYIYESSDSGKKAYGSLDVSAEGVRDAQAQRNAGGKDRRADDDGGQRRRTGNPGREKAERGFLKGETQRGRGRPGRRGYLLRRGRCRYRRTPLLKQGGDNLSPSA